MTVRHTLAALSVGLVLVATQGTAIAAGRPHGMTPAAYGALVAQGQALNARYGNAVTRLSPKQFIELYNAGGSSTAAPPASTSSTFFAWDDFGIGAAAAVGLILLFGGIVVAARSGRRTRVVAHIG